jgi:hypothetical protein
MTIDKVVLLGSEGSLPTVRPGGASGHRIKPRMNPGPPATPAAACDSGRSLRHPLQSAVPAAARDSGGGPRLRRWLSFRRIPAPRPGRAPRPRRRRPGPRSRCAGSARPARRSTGCVPPTRPACSCPAPRRSATTRRRPAAARPDRVRGASGRRAARRGRPDRVRARAGGGRRSVAWHFVSAAVLGELGNFWDNDTTVTAAGAAWGAAQTICLVQTKSYDGTCSYERSMNRKDHIHGAARARTAPGTA